MGCASSRPVLRCLRPSVAGGGASDPVDEVLGHSFCYSRSSSLSSAAAGETSFKSISGAALSANSSAPLPSFPFRASSDSAASASSRFLSGPISLSDRLDSVSGPLPRRPPLSRKPSLLRRSLSERNRPWVVPLRSSASRRSDLDANLASRGGGRGVQWARGKAGEDRVHVVVSEEHRWVFVGIYDGFNGPDAPEFLVSRLYSSLLIHLEGLFWHEEDEQQHSHIISESSKPLRKFLDDRDEDAEFDLSGSGRFSFSMSRLKYELGKFRAPSRYRVAREVKKRAGIQRRRKAGPVEDHGLVLGALARALEVTEMEYLEMTDRTMGSNPELAMTGSCLLVVLMRDDDVYVMNVGDSRAIVAQSGDAVGVTELVALQLSTDHSTSIEQEVLRIQQEHPDDNQCVVNNRVKGRLKVTRAFGAGFLKHPKWNNGLLEMFRNDYIGTAPYVTSSPSLCHHKLGADDQFLVLSSDGLYQYLSNEEVVLHVQNFMVRFPDGDPAQSLIEELLSRAAKNAGMELSELLDIPQGDRRKYHDDVTVMVISLEGRIWKSSEKCL